MTDHTALIDTYLAAYGEADETRRQELVAQCFAVEANLADPPFAATGHRQLTDTFGAVVGQFPGHRFARTSGIDEHHGVARYTWALNAPDGTTAVAGTDIVRFGDDGLIAEVTGFFGDPPARD